MGLLLDGSTPAPVHGGAGGGTASQSITTASFTPPSGSVLVICGGWNSSGSDTLTTLSVSDNLGTPLSYTTAQTEGNTISDAYIRVWNSSPSIGSTMTVTLNATATGVTGAGFFYLYLYVLVFTGANTSAPIGAHGGGRGATGVISDGYSSTATNSWGWLLCGDWSASAAPTVPAGETVKDSEQVSGQITYALIQQSSLSGAAGSSVTMSTTAPTSGAQISHLYFEVVPAAAPPANPYFFSRPFAFFDTGDYR